MENQIKQQDDTIHANLSENASITFHMGNPHVVMTISAEGIISFPDSIKEANADEIAKQVITLLEDNTATKVANLKQILRSVDGRKFADYGTMNFVKAVLFDKIYNLYIGDGK